MFNKLVISHKQVAPTNMFELCVTYMHGDADHYTKDKYYYGKGEEKKVLEHINFLAACMAKFPHGMGGNDGYWDVPGYEEYGEDAIPRDNECCDGHATVEEVEVFWFNDEGKQFLVTAVEE